MNNCWNIKGMEHFWMWRSWKMFNFIIDLFIPACGWVFSYNSMLPEGFYSLLGVVTQQIILSLKRYHTEISTLSTQRTFWPECEATCLRLTDASSRNSLVLHPWGPLCLNKPTSVWRRPSITAWLSWFRCGVTTSVSCPVSSPSRRPEPNSSAALARILQKNTTPCGKHPRLWKKEEPAARGSWASWRLWGTKRKRFRLHRQRREVTNEDAAWDSVPQWRKDGQRVTQ